MVNRLFFLINSDNFTRRHLMSLTFKVLNTVFLDVLAKQNFSKSQVGVEIFPFGTFSKLFLILAYTLVSYKSTFCANGCLLNVISNAYVKTRFFI